MKRLTAATAGLLSAGLLAGCGTGLHNQTYKNRDEANSVNVSVGAVVARNLAVAAPPTGSYSVGSDAVVTGQLSNHSDDTDTLVSATSSAARAVFVVPAGAAATPSGSASPVPSAVASAPAGSTGASPAPSAGAVPSSAPSLVSSPVAVPPQGLATPGWSLVLSGLTGELRSGQYVTLVLQFSKAGQVTVVVPVSPGADQGSTPGPSAVPGFAGDPGNGGTGS